MDITQILDETYFDDEPDKESTILDILEAYGRSLTKPERNYLDQPISMSSTPGDDRDSSLLLDVMYGDLTPQGAAAAMQQVFEPNRPKTKASSEVPTYNNRSAVNSMMIALNASKQDEVKEFRKSVLRNKLLTPDKVGGWIRRRTKAKSGKELFYWIIDKSGGSATSVYIPEGVLEDLRQLSVKVSGAFGWTQAQSTTWVLTGIHPIVEAIEIEAHIFPVESTANKLMLKIDPTSTDAEIIDAFHWAKEEFFAPRTKRNTRKNECLALFYRLTEDMTRKEKLKRWNKFCEDEKKPWGYDPYLGSNNFGRDLKHAYQGYLEGREQKGD